VLLRVLVVLCAVALVGCSSDNVDAPLEFFPGSQRTSWADCDKFGGGGNDIQVCAGLVNTPGSGALVYSISFYLPSPADVRIVVFDAHGKLVKVLLNDAEPATIGGFRVPPVEWDLTDTAGARVPGGDYRAYMQVSPTYLSSSDIEVP
jgi:hypothetical protein